MSSKTLQEAAAEFDSQSPEEKFLHRLRVICNYVDAWEGKDFGGDWESIAILSLDMTAYAEQAAEKRVK